MFAGTKYGLPDFKTVPHFFKGVTKMTSKLISKFRKFHSDEDGLEALQVVMIIAIAAMVMLACATLGKAAVTWMQGKWTTLQGTDVSGGAGGAGGLGAGGLLGGLLNGQNK
jgi:Flp pilus assembly pilin Flp